jgi:ATP-dependent RNA helicase DDX21
LIEKLVAEGLNEKRGGEGLPLVLILEPTRELAIQVAQELSSVCGVHRMRVQAIYGGASFETQQRAIRSGVHFIVATPGRALDHISRGTIDLGNVRHVVLDEGDTMLEMGFQKDVEAILSNIKAPGEKSRALAKASLDDMTGDSDDDEDDDEFDEDDEDEEEVDDDDVMSMLVEEQKASPVKKVSKGRNVQMLLFSATMPGWICQLTDKHMDSPIFLDAVQEGETRLAETIEHLAMRLPPVNDRTEAVGAFMEDVILTKGAGGQTIVFTNTKEEADRLAASEFFGQLRTQVIHGDISQNTRQTTIKSFKQGTIEVLIATDVAARGLDIAGVDLVVHTAPPMDSDTYVHRSGRTGRAGRNGTSVVLYSGFEERKLSTYEQALKFRFTKVGPPSAREISAACAILASKRLSNIDKNAAKFFTHHAQELIKAIKPEGVEDPSAPVFSVDDMEDLVARCLAAISNRNSINARSMLTGESDMMTIQVDAVFKNGSTPETTRDWTRLVTGVLHRSLGLEDIRFGRMTMARTPTRSLCCLFDMPSSQAHEVLEMLKSTKLPGGVTLVQCEALPLLVSERMDRGERGSYGERSGSYGGDRGSSYGGDRGGSYGGDRGGYRGESRGPSRSYGGSGSSGPSSAGSVGRSGDFGAERRVYVPRVSGDSAPPAGRGTFAGGGARPKRSG